MLATWRSFTWSSGFATGEEPRHVRPKAFYVVTQKFMAKWEIRFQRFALSFRPSALGHCCFRFSLLAFSLQPLAFVRALYADLPRRNSVKTGVPMAGRRREPLAFAGALASGRNVTILGLTLSGDCRHGQKWASPHIVIDAADFGFSGFVR
jgi:hypothetical protein